MKKERGIGFYGIKETKTNCIIRAYERRTDEI